MDKLYAKLARYYTYPITPQIERHQPPYPLPENQFISPRIRQTAEKEYTHCSKIREGNITIYYCTRYPFTPRDTKHIFHILHRIIALRAQVPGAHRKPLTLTIIPTRFRKHFPSRGALTPHNVNSGSYYPPSSIYIWRSQDLLKVLCHEVFHHLHPEWNEAQTEAQALLTDALFAEIEKGRQSLPRTAIPRLLKKTGRQATKYRKYRKANSHHPDYTNARHYYIGAHRILKNELFQNN